MAYGKTNGHLTDELWFIYDNTDTTA